MINHLFLRIEIYRIHLMQVLRKLKCRDHSGCNLPFVTFLPTRTIQNQPLATKNYKAINKRK
ncbi:hypothetical protein CSQ88_11460 [Iodobacter sp. BJB302]|nr:hypothetical protein CSQ88_11460 [Iodobacter sp. BJB302]